MKEKRKEYAAPVRGATHICKENERTQYAAQSALTYMKEKEEQKNN